MTFEDYIKTRLELRAEISLKIGKSQELGSDKLGSSIMTWDNKSDGTWFWGIDGDCVKLVQFVGSDDKQ